jgi:hypothetical protein
VFRMNILPPWLMYKTAKYEKWIVCHEWTQGLRIYSLLLKISPHTCLITANLQALVSLFYSTTLSVDTLIQCRWRMNKRYWWNDTYRRKAEYLQRSFSQWHFVSRKYQTDWSGIKRRNILCSRLWQCGLTWLICDQKFAFISWII